MPYELYETNSNNTARYVYLDNNVFRPFKREIVFWNNLFSFFEHNDPELLQDIEFIFTWSQLFEDINEGKIISDVIQHIMWKTEIGGFKDQNIDNINTSLDRYFFTACKILATIPKLHKDALLQKIDDSIKYGHPLSGPLIKSTLLAARDIVSKNNHIEELAHHISWAIITSEEFIRSKDQWKNRNEYLNSLTAGWYKCFSNGNRLNFYRLLERRYCAYVTHSPNAVRDPLNHEPLKSRSDLCDGELIDFTALGFAGLPVIGITFDEVPTLENRLSIMKQSLIDLERDVEGWDIKPIPGKIISLTKQGNEIISAHCIPFNAPLQINEQASREQCL